MANTIDVETAFQLLSEAIMLLPEATNVQWESEDDEGNTQTTKMDLATYVLWSYARVLRKKSGLDEETIDKALKTSAEADEEALIENKKPYHTVRFGVVGGRRKTRKHKK